MQSSNHIAFKEWAAIDAALGDGIQTLIVRKGGIHEGREGFRVAYREFWIFPTYVHEAAAGLEPEAVLPRLAGQQVWSAKTIGERFHYRQPGLFVLAVRVYVAHVAHIIPDSPHFAGCRSWVELPVELSTASLEPVLSDDEFARRRERIGQALGVELT